VPATYTSINQSINQSHGVRSGAHKWSSENDKPVLKRTALATLLAPLRAGGAVYQENLRTFKDVRKKTKA
jgi:hypothetical protein